MKLRASCCLRRMELAAVGSVQRDTSPDEFVNPLDVAESTGDIVPSVASTTLERYPSLYRMLLGMGARGPLPWRVSTSVLLLFFLAFVATAGPSSLTGRTERIPEDLPLQVWAVACPSFALSSQLLFAYSSRLSGAGMLMDQMLSRNAQEIVEAIEIWAHRAVKLWCLLCALMIPVGSKRILDSLASDTPQFAPAVGVIYFVLMPIVWALVIGVPLTIYAGTMSVVAEFTVRCCTCSFPIPQNESLPLQKPNKSTSWGVLGVQVVQSKLLESRDGLSGARLVNALNAKCNQFSGAATSIVTTLTVLAISGISGMMAAVGVLPPSCSHVTAL